MVKEILKATPISKIMTSPVISVGEWEDFHVVQDKFETFGIRHLPVVSNSGRIVGLISQRDIYRICTPHRIENGGLYYDKDMLDTFILKNVMVQTPYVLKADNCIGEAMIMMDQFKFGCIPIVDAKEVPIGIITWHNIIKFLLSL